VKMHNECRLSERTGYGVGVEVTCCRWWQKDCILTYLLHGANSFL